MIPKIINYVWLGGNEKPDLVKNCIASWQKNCADYEIKEWNESNLDLAANDFIVKVLAAKKWAFAADYFRLWILYNHGGIYLDSDVEVLKNFDEFLHHKAFAGFECNKNHFIEAAVIGAEAGLDIVNAMLKPYLTPPENLVYSDGQMNFKVIPIILCEALAPYAFEQNDKRQKAGDFEIYPSDYFCCKNNDGEKIVTTQNSHCIHHFTGSWLNKNQQVVMRYKNKFGVFAKPLLFLTRPRIAFKLLFRKLKGGR